MTIKTWILTLVDRTTQRGSSFKNYNENVHRSMDCWSWQMLNKWSQRWVDAKSFSPLSSQWGRHQSHDVSTKEAEITMVATWFLFYLERTTNMNMIVATWNFWLVQNNKVNLLYFKVEDAERKELDKSPTLDRLSGGV